MNNFILLALILTLLSINSHGDRSVYADIKQDTLTSMTKKEPLETELAQAIQQGKLDIVKQILKENQVALKNLKEEIQFNLLDIATYRGHIELVKYLLEEGIDVNVSEESGRIALHYAIWHGKTDIAYYLIDKGADVNALYNANGGLTPLCCAAEYGDLDLVKYLVKHGAKIHYENESSGASPIRSAAYKGQMEVYKYLADQMPNDFDWQLSLSQAIVGESPELVKYIVENKKVDVNKQSSHWGYPIQTAAERYFNPVKNIEIMEYLLSKGAKLTDINHGKVFPWALEKCNEETIVFLLDKGVKFVPDNSEGSWPSLPDALDQGRFKLAQYLLKKEKDYTYRGLPLVIFFADGMHNSAAIIAFLIHNGINKEHYAQAYLHSASQDDLESVKILLETGVDINITDEKAYNALALTKSENVASYLIKEGINTDNEKFGEGVLFKFGVLRALGEANITLNIDAEKANEALIQASRIGDDWVVDYLLKHGVNPNIKSAAIDPYWLRGDRKGTKIETTPLIENAMQGYSSCNYGDNLVPADVTKLLLKAGAEVNMTNQEGKTALHYASGNQWCRVMIGPIPMGSRRDREQGFHGDPEMPPTQQHDSIMIALIEGDADLNIQDNDGNTPLMLAAIHGNTAGIKLLLQYGARTDLKNEGGKIFFDLISDANGIISLLKADMKGKITQEVLNKIFLDLCTEERYNYEVDKIRILLDNGADVNAKSERYSATSLHFIIEYGYESDVFFEVVSLLLDRGSNIEIQEDSQERTALHLAIDKGRSLKLIELLLDYGANTNAQNYKGDTPLMQTLIDYKRQTIIFNLLMNRGTDIHIKNKSGMTAFTLANVFGFEEEATRLINAGAKRDLSAEWWLTLAYSSDRFDDLQKLMDGGVDINMKSTHEVNYRNKIPAHGVTALMYMASLNNAKNVKKLIAMGADVSIRDNNGKTALDYPYENWDGKAETLKALREE